jgi:O-antigen/teichoic acid export membrane protein
MNLYKKFANKHTLSLASNAVMPVMGMVTISILARNLTKADFGSWIIFLITYTIANFFRSGFLQTSLVKFYAGASSERKLNIAGSTWFLGLAVAIILSILSFCVFLINKGNASTEIIIKWLAIIFFSSLPSSIALWILQAEERFDRMFILQLVGQGSFFVSVIILVILNKAQFQMVIYTFCVSAIITSLFTIIAGWAKITSIVYKSKACIKELANFGKYSVGTSISSYLLRGSDSYIIKYMFVDPSFVGVYYLPQRLMEIIEIPLRSFIATALPAMATAMHQNDKRHMTYIMKKYAGILTILLIPVSITAFIGADLIIEIIGGRTFIHSDATTVFRIFMCFAILLPVDRFFGVTLDILNKPHLNMIKVMLMLIVNVVGDFAGIYYTHSIVGVALASILSFLVGVVYGYIVLKKYLNFTMTDILKLGFVETKLLLLDLPNRFKQKAKKEDL